MKTEYRIDTGVHLKDMNTFGIDAVADVVVTYYTPEALPEIAGLLQTQYAGMPVMHIGAGSNILPADNFHGVVLKSAIMGVERDGNTLRAGAAETFDRLITYSLSEGLYGLENLSLIPGEVGASAVQNIGAYGVEAKDFIVKVEGYDFGEHRFFCLDNEECRYGYRDSIFKHELRGRVAITHVTFRLSDTFCPNLSYAALAKAVGTAERLTAADLRTAVIGMRHSKLPDPEVLGNAGSFFMNPIVCREQYEKLLKDYPDMPCFNVAEGMVKLPAAWLIERSGWKGRSLGRAGVYEKQALVLVNLGGATGREVVELKDRIVGDVAERFGITIQPEVNILC